MVWFYLFIVVVDVLAVVIFLYWLCLWFCFSLWIFFGRYRCRFFGLPIVSIDFYTGVLDIFFCESYSSALIMSLSAILFLRPFIVIARTK